MDGRSQIIFTVTLLALVSHSEVLEVTSPQKVVGNVHQATILPCSVSSTKPLEDLEVEWQKISEGKVETVFARGKLGKNQSLEYLGRTSLAGEVGLTSGNISLRLEEVQPEDGGTYSCSVRFGNQSFGASVDLEVSGVGEVIFEVLGPQGEGLQLACRSEGWFPQPTVRWVVRGHQDLVAETTLRQEDNRLFSVFSRLTVTRGQGEEVTCRVVNPLLRMEETTLRLASSIFPSQSPWMPSFWTIFTLFLITLAVGAVRVYRGCRKNSADSDDEVVESAWDTLRSEIGLGRDPRRVVSKRLDQDPESYRGLSLLPYSPRSHLGRQVHVSYLEVTSESRDHYSHLRYLQSRIER